MASVLGRWGNAMISYKIIELIPERHTAVVRYWSDDVPLDALVVERDSEGNPLRCSTDIALSLPIPLPEGPALHDFLLSRAPVQELQLVKNVNDPAVDTSLDGLRDLVGLTFEGDPPAPRQLIVSTVARL